jgi:hypothetical protein
MFRPDVMRKTSFLSMALISDDEDINEVGNDFSRKRRWCRHHYGYG